MKKIKISQNILTGAPLSDEDLKLIIGGNARYSNSCKCTYFDRQGGSSVKEIQVYNESDCRQKCANLCSSNPECMDVAWAYGAMS